MPMLRQVFGGWSFSETAFLHSGLPFSVLSQPYSANGNGVFQASNPRRPSSSPRPNYANRVPGVPLYRKTPYPGVTVTGTKQWLNPDAFVSVVDPDDRGMLYRHARRENDNPTICQFGNSGRNSVRGPHFTYSDMYITKTFPIREGITLRIDAQMFNAFNHPNFALPSTVEAGVPGSVPCKIRNAAEHDLAAYRAAWRGSRRRQLAAHDCLSGQDRVLKAGVLLLLFHFCVLGE